MILGCSCRTEDTEDSSKECTVYRRISPHHPGDPPKAPLVERGLQQLQTGTVYLIEGKLTPRERFCSIFEEMVPSTGCSGTVIDAALVEWDCMPPLLQFLSRQGPRSVSQRHDT